MSSDRVLPVPDSAGLVGNSDFFHPRERQASGARSCPPPAPRKIRPSSRLSPAHFSGDHGPLRLGEASFQSQSGLYQTDPSATTTGTPQQPIPQWLLRRRGFIGLYDIPNTVEQEAVIDFIKNPPEGSQGKLSYFQLAFKLFGNLTTGKSIGEVYRVFCYKTNKYYAVKRSYDDPGSIMEAEIASVMQHSSIVPVKSAWSENGFTYLLMDLCGQTLGQFLRTTAPSWRPTEMMLLCWAGHAATAVQYVHSKGVVHLDIKPDNLFFAGSNQSEENVPLPLRQGYRVLLGDFGSALVMSKFAGSDTSMRGDDRYIAPERVASYEADIFSLGATLFDIVMDIEMPRSPDGMWDTIRSGKIDKLKGFMRRKRGTPEYMIDLIARMMARNPKDRPSVTEVVKILNERLQVLMQSLTSASPCANVGQARSHALITPDLSSQPALLAASMAGDGTLLYTPEIDPAENAGGVYFSEMKDKKGFAAGAGQHTREFSSLIARADDDESSKGNVSADASISFDCASMADSPLKPSSKIYEEPIIPQLAETSEAQRQMMLCRSDSSSLFFVSPSLVSANQRLEQQRAAKNPEIASLQPLPASHAALQRQRERQEPEKEEPQQPPHQQQRVVAQTPRAQVGPVHLSNNMRFTPRRLFDGDSDDEEGDVDDDDEELRAGRPRRLSITDFDDDMNDRL